MTSDRTHAWAEMGRLSRLAWVPIPVSIASLAVAWTIAWGREPHDSPGLLLALNIVFSTLASLAVAFLMGRSFLVRSTPGTLLLGCGVLIWGVGSLVAHLVGRGNFNDIVTIHNLCIWLASGGHLASVLLSQEPRRAAGAVGLWIGAAYSAAIGLVWLVVALVLAGWLPSFFVGGRGGTPVRYFVLASAISMIVLSAGLLRPTRGGASSAFAYWYSLGLMLLAIGLFGVMIEPVPGSPLSWTGRLTQFLGGAYMLVASFLSAREPVVPAIAPEAGQSGPRQRYLVAVTLVLAAAVVRSVFLQSLGSNSPFITFYPAVMLAALHGGLGPGLISVALSALVGDYFWIEPAGRLDIRTLADWVVLAVFLLSGTMMSAVSEALHRARARAHEAETQAQIAAERERAEEALSRSEERYHTLFETLIEGFCTIELIFDAEGRAADFRFLEVNPAFEKQSGLHDAQGRLMRDLNPNLEEYWFEIYGRVASTGEPVQFENEAKELGRYYDVCAYRIGGPESRRVAILFNDITERKRAERLLLDRIELQDQLAKIAITVPGAIYSFRLRPDGHCCMPFAVPAIEDLFGASPGALVEDMTPVFANVHPDDLQDLIDGISEAARLPSEWRKVYRYLHPKKGERWIEGCGAPQSQVEPDGSIVWHGFLTDVTERKRVDEALRDSRARLEAIVNTAIDAIITIDLEGTVLSFNPAAERIFGFPTEEVLGRNVSILMPSPFREQHDGYLDRYRETGLTRVIGSRHEIHGMRKDGTIFPIEIGVSEIGVGSDRLFVGLLRDITERKRAEEEIRELNASLERRVAERTSELLLVEQQRRRLAEIVEMSPDFVGMADPEGRVLYLNRAFVEALGRSPDRELLHVVDCHPEGALRVIREEGFPTAAAAGVWRGETEFITHDGRSVPVSQLIVAHSDPEGSLEYYSTIMREMTERNRTEQELRTQSERLELANADLGRAARLKDEFLASMSHELRTPLNAILGMCELLQEEVCGRINPRQAECLRDVEQSGRHLLGLINDILDLSKIGAGKLDLEPTPTPVNVICEAALRMVRQNALAKRLRVTTSIDGAVEIILADGRRLKQVLVNLLSNAVKFTPEGGAIGLDVCGAQDRKSLTFTIWDSGIGIRRADMGLLFQPFRQIDSRLSRQYAGTGLGLALVRKISELHGGSVSVESEPGKGSRFTVTIPWLEAAAPSGAVATPGSISRIRSALLIEDSTASVAILTRYLDELHIPTNVHPRGSGALERVAQERPDVVLLDLILPDADGWGLLSALKEAPDSGEIPVVVISDLDERARGLALGASEYLVKPISREQLRSALERVAASRPKRVDRPPPEEPLLLLAEDDPTGASLLTTYLQDGGYRIARASDGHEAIRLTRELSPRLILMDIQMPGMDGLEATRRIRADPQTREIPIVAVTAMAMAGDRERCLEAGADAYLSKPISLRELRQLVDRMIAETRGGNDDASGPCDDQHR